MDHSAEQHPLAHSFQRAQTLSEYLKVSYGAPPDEGWVAADSVFAAHTEHFDTLVHAVQQRLRTRSANIIAGSLLQGYQWQLVASAIACYLLDRRVPDLDAASIRLRYNEAGEAEAITFTSGHFVALPDDPAADHPDALVVASVQALSAALRSGIESHLGQTIDQLCARLDCKPRGLWLNVADGCAGTLTWLMQQHDPAAGVALIEAEVDALVRAPGSPLNTTQLGLIELTYQDRTQVFLDRASCCYWYKTEGGAYCSTCPHRTPDDRNAQLLKYMAEQHVDQAST